MKKKNLRRLTAAFLVLAMLFALSGCGAAMTAIEMLQSSGASSSSSESTSPAEGNTLSGLISQAQSLEKSSSSTETLPSVLPQVQSSSSSEPEEFVDETNSLVWVHQLLLDTESICGVAFVGYTDGPMGGGYREYIEESKYYENYPFMAEIPSEHIVVTEGDELYCITPFNAESIAISWMEQDITTLPQAEAEIKRLTTEHTYLSQIRTMFEMQHSPTSQQKKYIESWRTAGYAMDLIKFAYELTLEKIEKLNFKYINTILEKWTSQGITTLEQAENSQKAFAASRAETSSQASAEMDEYLSVVNRFRKD